MDYKASYQDKRVLVTGHTGFKGSWLCRILLMLGADVHGYALEPPTEPSLFALSGLEREMDCTAGDVRDLDKLKRVFERVRPEIVFHLAAQPIVRTGYADPVGTYETNVMGTVHVLECIRQTAGVRSFLNVTTDKVYENREWEWPYRENEPLNGFDPYANSKSCSELVTDCYRKSFLDGLGVVGSTVRAGNVIGGGDFAPNRIIPDCVRAAAAGETILVRNPDSVRPYQHVLDALFAYLQIAAEQTQNPALPKAYNIGPDESSFLRTGELADLFVRSWGGGARWEACPDGGPHEDKLLKIDCSRMRRVYGWKPRWKTETAVRKSVEWYRCWHRKDHVIAVMEEQIHDFLDLVEGTPGPPGAEGP